MRFIFFSIFLIFLECGFTQSVGSISGRVQDEKGNGVSFATIAIKEVNKGTNADLDGHFSFKNLPSAKYMLVASAIGYKKSSTHLTVQAGRNVEIQIVLPEDSKKLQEVIVTEKTQATIVREQAYAVEVVEARAYKNLSVNGNDILRRISGVNIRQAGGLGSPFSLSLNGLSGNQVRIFLDGVPMDYFGTSLSLNNFSANLIERIEVYKGVVPIHLSSDALGGAINIVTGSKTESFVDASASIGSFGTRIASLNTQYRNQKNGFTTRMKSFYNYSNNNYKIPIHIVHHWPRGNGKAAEEATSVERKNDAYESRMVWFETGFVATKFVDKLLIGLMYSDNYKEIMQGERAIGPPSNPYGEVLRREDKLLTNLSFQKSGMLNNRLSINSYMVAVFGNALFRDTSSYLYYWDLDRELRPDPNFGELENRKTLFNTDADNYLGNINAELKINDNSNVAFNYSFNHYIMQGEDPLKERNSTQFKDPSTVSKQVAGLSYTHLSFNERFQNSLFTKSYKYGIKGIETNWGGNESTAIDEHRDYFGFGIASTFKASIFQIKASYENATRFPEVIEIFGDGTIFNESNVALLPENSRNYNAGVEYKNRSSVTKTQFELNLFLRNSDDFIIEVTEGIRTHRENRDQVETRGIDFSSLLSYKNRLIVNLNGTYYQKRDMAKWRHNSEGESEQNNLYKARFPNEPYFLSNLTIAYRHQNTLNSHDNVTITFNQVFASEFFYSWQELGNKDKNIVPEQWSSDLEVVYSLHDGKYNTSFGILNLFNNEVYDNFLQQKPGRTYSLKFRYFF